MRIGSTARGGGSLEIDDVGAVRGVHLPRRGFPGHGLHGVDELLDVVGISADEPHHLIATTVGGITQHHALDLELIDGDLVGVGRHRGHDGHLDDGVGFEVAEDVDEFGDVHDVSLSREVA